MLIGLGAVGTDTKRPLNGVHNQNCWRWTENPTALAPSFAPRSSSCPDITHLPSSICLPAAAATATDAAFSRSTFIHALKLAPSPSEGRASVPKRALRSKSEWTRHYTCESAISSLLESYLSRSTITWHSISHLHSRVGCRILVGRDCP